MSQLHSVSFSYIQRALDTSISLTIGRAASLMHEILRRRIDRPGGSDLYPAGIFTVLPAWWSFSTWRRIASSTLTVTFGQSTTAMARKWSISSQTICLDGLDDQDKADLLAALQRAGLNVIVMQDDNTIVRGINDRANGVAQPALNFGAVEFNYQESAKILSHETLHLMLEEADHPRSCYVDAVHDNAHRFARYGDVVILAHFDC